MTVACYDSNYCLSSLVLGVVGFFAVSHALYWSQIPKKQVSASATLAHVVYTLCNTKGLMG